MSIKWLPYVVVFLSSLLLTLVLTPIVRELNRRLGMVDLPDVRRINKKPIPRGGGIAIVIGVIASYAACVGIFDIHPLIGVPDSTFWKLIILSVAIAVLGLADDKFNLPPKVKLAGQLAVAFLVWFWADLGFSDLWPSMPWWVDVAITVFWICGAVNAFNLIDGLDGLASGLALIAILGMAGALVFTGSPNKVFFYLSFAGGLIGFLRYNYNPASVFLGDSGSMFLGYILAVLPLCSHAPNSFLVSVGVPLLAMGVPIFDTSLAILRRSIRHLINRGSDNGSGKVMTADTDHLHHRILRAFGFSQRKAAWMLYAMSIAAVLFGLVALSLKSRAGGFWIVAFAVAVVVIFRDMSRIELFDAGRLLGSVAHDTRKSSRRRWARLTVPFYVVFDIAALTLAYRVVCISLNFDKEIAMLSRVTVVRVASVFVFLVLFRAYRTIWARAMISNYLRLMLACLFGTWLGSAIMYYIPSLPTQNIAAFTLAYATLSLIAVTFVRTFRAVVRDFFYLLDCRRLVGRKDVSRVLVYGAGLRYRAFRRELVRSAASNNRIIVGIIDDDILLRNHYIGGIRIMGTLAQAPQIINTVNADSVVIACDIGEEWLKVVKSTLAPTGVKVTRFSFSETDV